MSPSPLLELAQRRVLVLDGAMGTSVHALDLGLSDYDGCENCTEVLNSTRPDAIGEIHRSFLAVGCDAVKTNTFGANKIVLADFDLADRAYDLNRLAAELARKACAAFSKNGRPRFVIGSMGPGTRLPSLLQTSWDKLLESYTEQVSGLLDGGVDAVLIETCQDILQAKAAVVAATDAMARKNRCVPIFCTITIETTGVMLLGTDVAAAAVTLGAFPQIAAMGLNCATGPQEMSEHVSHLSNRWDRLLIVQPNAGLPKLVDGKSHFPLSPDELAKWLLEFVKDNGVNIVGGCCGTTPEHLAAVVDAIGERAPTPRQVVLEPSVSSLYSAVPIRQESSCLSIGERTNANGSKRFRELLAAEDLDGMVQVAREQERQGCHLLDVCTAYVGRDETRDMTRLLERLATEVKVPLVLDSTDLGVLEAALKLVGGKCVINSVNLEDGPDRVEKICALARRYGAAVIALTIDEEGMAKTADRKVAIARRIFELATEQHGIAASNLIFDPLTFTICTGSADDRRLGLETLEALGQIKKQCPGAHTLLGVSNISFGLKPPTRRVINSVFLHYAREQGLDAAILHLTGIVPLYRIDKEHRRLAEDLIFDRRKDDYEPLHELMRAFETVAPTKEEPGQDRRPIEQRLKHRIVDGDRTGLEEDLDEAMRTHPPLTIINDILLDGMRTVGDLFAAGQMQLPFVLQSAETMKAAVRQLEPYMEDAGGSTKGTIVLATVRGDVHDIGKNLVDIILSNNGYTVHNLGIKQPINNIIEACEKHDADAIGLSGLLVKSTVVMRESLPVLNERGVRVPVILGGAALTRRYVEQELRPEYRGPLYYAKDAFEGLRLMEQIVTDRAAAPKSQVPEPVGAPVGPERSAPPVPPKRTPMADVPPRPPDYAPPQSDISREEPVPTPPFWGARLIEHIDPQTLLPLLNENMLFQVQWGYRKSKRGVSEFKQYIEDEVRPILRDLLATCEREQILRCQAIYGFWPVQADGDTLIIFDPDDRDRRLDSFEFPRQGKPPYWCISDFFRPVSGGVFDVVALSIVTSGRRVSEVAREWFAADRYVDYLHLHGLGVELAEAMAEHIHKQIRADLSIDGSDPSDRQLTFKQRYQGSRYSFGYPACPRLEDQVKLWPLLEPGRIGVELTEGFQLEPEQTTTALIVHHKQAKYFNVR